MSEPQQYVKLTARPDTWFKAGAEVWHYDAPRRLTLAEWNGWAWTKAVLVRGIRVCEDNDNENGMGCKPGEERVDGEYCSIDEFDLEIVEEDKDFTALENRT